MTEYDSAVAVIGMSGRFPGAGSVDELWRNLVDGVPGLRELSEEELRAAGVSDDLLADPDYVRVGGPLDGIDQFDAAVFGFSPREAETMEPQHRLFLECSWEALEAAGYCPTDAPGQVGVFGGCGFPFYMIHNVRHVADEPGGDLLLGIGNERDSLASLVSYKLGLRGPSVAVQSFCSTSLVAVHLAVQSLLTYDCDIALAGGAFTPLPQPAGYRYEQGSIVSPDGRVRSFDAGATGSVMGSGVGVVALKRMSEAMADGDVIRAVILGSASNNDGRTRAGFTAPGVDGQSEVIGAAIAVAGVKPETIGYVECHATGTSLGDSIELAAMNRVFQQTPERPCVLGSLKPSIGHLDRASGVAGLIRATMVLENGLLPAMPNWESPNPALATDRFTVLTEHTPWQSGVHPRRAGVSSFGLGGTNAHVVLEQPPTGPRPAPRPGPHLLTFSAADAHALTDLTERLRAHLADRPDLELADVAYTLQVSRGGFALRRAVVCADVADAVAALADPDRWLDGQTSRRNPRLRVDGPAPVAEWLTGLGVRLADDPADAVDVVAVPADTAEARLAALAAAWLAGSTVDWPTLHGRAGRRLTLPTYPFQRRRFWVDPVVETGVPASAGKTFDRSRWTHLPTWRQRPEPIADLDERLRAAGPWLVLSDEHRGEALISALTAAGAEVSAVRPGGSCDQDDNGDFTVRSGEPADLDEVLRSLLVLPRTIVHGFALAAPEPAGDPVGHFLSEQDRGLHSAMALAAALVDDTGSAPPVDLVLLTSGAAAVTGPDLRHPEHATLAAVGTSLAQENPRLTCRQVDLDEVAPDDAVGLRRLVGQVLGASVREYQGPVAVRSGETWLRAYDPLPLPAEHAPVVRAGATVLITGGLGDVGLVLARHFAATYRANLVLTVRSPLPPRARWDAFLAAVPDGGERTARHIRAVLALEAAGAQVLAASADVSDVDSMRAVVAAAGERFGPVELAVHAAGIQDDRHFTFAHLISAESCALHLAAKIRGFLVLREVLPADCPGVTLSSLAAVLGGMTLAPYAAANAGLDAYVRAARLSDDAGWVTVDWDTWNVDADRMDAHGATVRDFAMTPPEGVDVLERALAARDTVGHLVISTGSLAARIAQWVINGGPLADTESDDAKERHPRPDLATPFREPSAGIEARIAEIWSAVLGVEPVGADDNFFDLGGHSLVAIKLTTRIRKALDAAVPATALIECPTVRDLARLIEEGP